MCTRALPVVSSERSPVLLGCVQILKSYRRGRSGRTVGSLQQQKTKNRHAHPPAHHATGHAAHAASQRPEAPACRVPCALRGCPHGHAPPSLAATTRELSPLPELQVDEIEAGRVPMLRVMKMAKRGRVPRVGGALGSGAAPRRANLRDQLATSVPRIHPRFCPIPAHQVPRAASRAKLAPFPTSSSRPIRRSSAVRRPKTGPGTGQVWILHGAAVYLRAHGAFRGAPEACRLRGAAISAAPTIVSLIVTPSTRSQCVCSASTPATVTPSVLAYTG